MKAYLWDRGPVFERVGRAAHFFPTDRARPEENGGAVAAGAVQGQLHPLRGVQRHVLLRLSAASAVRFPVSSVLLSVHLYRCRPVSHLTPSHEQLLCDAFQDLPSAQLPVPVQWPLGGGEPADPLRPSPQERRARLVQPTQVHGEAHGALGVCGFAGHPVLVLMISLSLC